MISQSSVFDAIRRGYGDLEYSSNEKILKYFGSVEPDSMVGHINNIKGIVFEQEVANALNEQGLEAAMFEATNHPASDIALMSDGEIAAEFQLKATDSVSYINDTLELYPDIPIIATHEVADSVDSTMVIDSGLENVVLEDAVTEAFVGEYAADLADKVAGEVVNEGVAEMVGESILPIPISPIGIIAGLLGLPFL